MLGRFAASVQQLSRATESVLQFCVSMRPNDARSHCAGTSEVPSLRRIVPSWLRLLLPELLLLEEFRRKVRRIFTLTSLLNSSELRFVCGRWDQALG
jgi:hypothetical protein